jgi:mersacidin/lichenicidin family type 2 lantibiotic
MKKVNVIKAWTDQEYRQTLTAEEIASLPENPAGELSDMEQLSITGGYGGAKTAEHKTICSETPEDCRIF